MDIEELEKDRQQLIDQVRAISGAIEYISQKIEMLKKAKQEEEIKE